MVDESSSDAGAADGDGNDEFEPFWPRRVSPEDRERAITLLRRELPLKTLRTVHALVVHKDPDWPISGHFTIGIAVRNMLRRAEFPWGAAQLDDLWNELLEEAARRAIADDRS